MEYNGNILTRRDVKVNTWLLLISHLSGLENNFVLNKESTFMIA